MVHRFSRIFSVNKRFRNTVAVDETVVKLHSLRVYVWSAVDVDSVYPASRLRLSVSWLKHASYSVLQP